MDKKIDFFMSDKLYTKLLDFLEAYEHKNDRKMSVAEFIRAAVSEKLLREQNGGK